MLTELFGDQPQPTITSGGTDAPAAGTTETLTPALIAVTQAGSTWTVTRGVEGTTPVTHQAGFTAAGPVLSA